MLAFIGLFNPPYLFSEAFCPSCPYAMTITANNTEISSSSPTAVASSVVRTRGRSRSVSERITDWSAKTPRPMGGTESPSERYFAGERDSVRNYEELGSRSPPPVNRMGEPKRTGGLPSKPEVPPQSTAVPDPEIDRHYQLVPDPNARIGSLHVRPKRESNLENLMRAKRWVAFTLKVKMTWRRRDNWLYWHLQFVGPEDRLKAARDLADDVLTNPDHYEDPPEKEYGEFASVSKW